MKPKKYIYDVAIVGGGFAGVSAALSARREKKRVVLIESQYSLGGLATNGLISYYLPICDGKAHQLMYGIPYELFLLSLSKGHDENYPKHWLDYNGTYEEKINQRLECKFNPQLFALLSEKLLIDEGVDIFYGSTLISSHVEDNKIKYIEVASRTETFIIEAKAYVDGTGDATLNRYSGEEVIDTPIKNVPAYWFYQFNKDKYELINLGSTDYLVDFEKPSKVSTKGLDTKENSEYMADYHQFVLKKYLSYGKESKEHSLGNMANIPELRMTQKIKGTIETKFHDDHKYIDHSIGLFGDWTRPGPIWELPMEALYGPKIKNLFTAGRCIAVDNVNMWNVTRVIPVCALSGEAAGLLAASSCDGPVDIIKIQKTLKDRGVPLHVEEVLK